MRIILPVPGGQRREFAAGVGDAPRTTVAGVVERAQRTFCAGRNTVMTHRPDQVETGKGVREESYAWQATRVGSVLERRSLSDGHVHKDLIEA